MDKQHSILDSLLTENYTKDKKEVTIVVRLLDEQDPRWSLSIRGKGCQFTTWSQHFSCPSVAFSTAKKALAEEGIDEFYGSAAFC